MIKYISQLRQLTLPCSFLHYDFFHSFQFGQHLLKRTCKRLSLIDEKLGSPASPSDSNCSPLKDRNKWTHAAQSSSSCCAKWPSQCRLLSHHSHPRVSNRTAITMWAFVLLQSSVCVTQDRENKDRIETKSPASLPFFHKPWTKWIKVHWKQLEQKSRCCLSGNGCAQKRRVLPHQAYFHSKCRNRRDSLSFATTVIKVNHNVGHLVRQRSWVWHNDNNILVSYLMLRVTMVLHTTSWF